VSDYYLEPEADNLSYSDRVNLTTEVNTHASPQKAASFTVLVIHAETPIFFSATLLPNINEKV
jgi:hypothetical protein